MRMCLFTLSFCLFATAGQAHGEVTSLESYYADLNRSCKVDADCEVKDVGNCCGYLPQCVNKAAAINKQLVSQLCKEQLIMGTCGVQLIESCKCEMSQCRAILDQITPVM